jgi:hypothetical protein
VQGFTRRTSLLDRGLAADGVDLLGVGAAAGAPSPGVYAVSAAASVTGARHANRSHT